VIGVLSVLNFEFSIVKPGCTIGTVAFDTTYFYTIAVMPFAVAVFAAGAYVRGR
jgi:hypothetical protein